MPCTGNDAGLTRYETKGIAGASRPLTRSAGGTRAHGWGRGGRGAGAPHVSWRPARASGGRQTHPCRGAGLSATARRQAKASSTQQILALIRPPANSWWT